MEDNKEIIITSNAMDFNTDVIGIILITKDGKFLYGKVNEKIQYDYKNRIGHINIFHACAKRLGIDLSCVLDQMECAWQLAADDSNIINLQIIPPNDVIVVMNKKQTDEQYLTLSEITKYFAQKKYLFTADILDGDDKINIYNDSSTTCEFGLDLETFKDCLDEILLKSSKMRK